MSEKYVRILSILFFLLVSFFLSAQDISDVGSAKIDRMKREGKLTGREQYTNRAATPNVMRVAPPANSPAQVSTLCNCWIPRDASFQIGQFDGSGGSGGPGLPPDYRNDDWSTLAIPLPFNFCFYGNNKSQVFINNNGNITFGGPQSQFSGVSFPDTFQMIAPFWADVDTRAPLSGLVYYSITPTHMIVQWDHVGYFGMHDSLLNTFQLIITDGTDPIIPIGQNVSFCYQDMQWTTGDASWGEHGFPRPPQPPTTVGVPATVGVNLGDSVNYLQFGLFDTQGSNYDGAYGLNDGIDWLDNQSFNFNACVSGDNIPPVLNSLNICDTIRICQNTAYQLTANYLSPEPGQNTSITYFAPGVNGISVVSNTPGNTATLILNITSPDTGYHLISITATDNGLPPKASFNNVVIQVLPAPLPSYTFSPASPVAASTTVQFTNTTAPGSLLTWDFGDGSPTTTVPNPQHAFTAAGTYTVTLSAMFPNGCVTTVTHQIVVTSCSPATFTVNNACENAVSVITFTGTASALANFVWDFNNGTVLSGSGIGPYNVSWNASGNYNVTLTVTENTCSSTVVMPVNVYAIPISSISSLPSLCIGDIQNLNFNGTAGGGATYTWNFGAATVLSGTGAGPYNLQWNSTGSSQVSLIVNENGCSDTSQISVQVNPIPTADFTVAAAACANDVLNVTYNGTAGAGANYAWDFNGGTVLTGSGQGPYTASWNNGGAYNLSLTVTENGCVSPPVNMPLNVTATPVVSISAIPALCEGGTSNASFTGTAGATAAYVWNFGAATVLSGSGAGPYSLQWNTAGAYQVQLSVTENNCTSSSSVNVTVNAIPTSSFVVNNSACVDAPVNLSYTGTASPSANYNWVFSGGTVVSGSGAGPYSVSWSTQGNYQISLTVDENGCISPQTDLQAVVNPLPSVFAGNDQLVCSGTPVPLGRPATAGEIYQWTPAFNLSDPTLSDPVATPVNNSSATIQDPYILAVTDANGCVNNDTVLVSSYPVPVINFSDPAPQCIENNNFTFSGLSNIPAGVNFNWTFSPEASLLSSTQSNVNITYSTTGTFPVTLTADYNGCPAQSFTDSVTISEMPVSDFIPLVLNGCEPLMVPFTNLSTGDGNTYIWSFGDGTIGTAPTESHVYQDPGIYSVSLEAINKYGCAADTLFKNLIEVYALPVGHFVPNPQLANILAPIIQFQNYSTNAIAYTWSFGDGDTASIWSPSHTYSDTGNYSIILMLRSSEGCVDTVTGVVRVEDNFSFYVPNTFTPNGDGINDEFRGYGIAIRKYQMNIYDRWGKLIFATDNYDKAWDGKMKSGVVQNDTYVYRIQLVDHHNETHTYVGDITIVR